MNQPHFVFAGGGTGGHLFPGIAVAHALRAITPAAEITFFTTTRPLDRDLLAPTGFRQIAQPTRPMLASPLTWPGFLLAWRKSTRAAAALFREHRPAAVLGLGGYAAGPAVVVGHKLNIRTAILNPDAVPGKANKLLARHADRIVLQWDVSRRFFNAAAAAKCETLGCPIRAEFARPIDPEAVAACRRKFGLHPQRPVLLVTGASQGASSVNQTMIRVWPAFAREHPDWQLLHLTGSADEAAVRSAYASAGASREDSASTQVLAFTHDMADALAASDLFVSRAGASTLAELTALGRPSILYPYPYHKDQHQRHNAQVLVDAGAAILLADYRDGALNAAPLLAALRDAVPENQRAAMAAAARSLGRPAAATDIAEWLTATSPIAHEMNVPGEEPGTSCVGETL